MNWDALDRIRDAPFRTGPLLECMKPSASAEDNSLPVFEFMEQTPLGTASVDSKPSRTIADRTNAASRVPGFAAPTVAAQARAKVPLRQQGTAGKENAHSRSKSNSQLSKGNSAALPRAKMATIQQNARPQMHTRTSTASSIAASLYDDLLGSIVLPEAGPLPDIEVKFDFE
jgi:hypothetical protein